MAGSSKDAFKAQGHAILLGKLACLQLLLSL